MRRPFIPVVHGATLDRPDEADTLGAARTVAGALDRLGFDTGLIWLGRDLRSIGRLPNQHPRVVFNLVDALETDTAAANIVPQRLAERGLKFTGSATMAIAAAQSKLRTKEVLASSGIPTPHWSARGDALDGATRLIVKPVDEHASVGIDRSSVIDRDTAKVEIARREAAFGGRFFAEEFIDGREFNISLLESESGVLVLPIPEIMFVDFPADRPKIVDYGAKWLVDDPAFHTTPRRFGIEAREPALAAPLDAVARRVWRAFGLGGYARVDLRVDATGRPFVIDVNTNPCLSTDAGFAAAAAEAGIGYDQIIGRIVDAAVERSVVAAPAGSRHVADRRLNARARV